MCSLPSPIAGGTLEEPQRNCSELVKASVRSKAELARVKRTIKSFATVRFASSHLFTAQAVVQFGPTEQSSNHVFYGTMLT